MKSVYEIIARIASELPSDCIRMAAKSLASGTQCDDAVSLWGGSLAQKKLIADFGVAAKASGLSSGEIAAALLSAATTADSFFAENAVDILPEYILREPFGQVIDRLDEVGAVGGEDEGRAYLPPSSPN